MALSRTDTSDKVEESEKVGDPFHSSRYCLDHAERRIQELVGVVTGFMKDNPCRLIREPDFKTRQHVIKVKHIRDLPIEIPGIVFDTLNSMRSSLDHAGFATARATGKKGRYAHFPFGKTTRRELILRARGKGGGSREIPENIFQVMLKSKPYRRGNRLLWAMNDLCNANKHEIIIPMVIGNPMLVFSVKSGPSPTFSKKKWDSSKKEMEIARIPFGAKLGDKYKLAADVKFNGVNVVNRQSVVLKLKEMLMEVRRVFDTIEAEAMSSGVFRLRHRSKNVLPLFP